MATISVGFTFKLAVMCLPPYKKVPPGTCTNPYTHPHFILISQFHVHSLLTLFTPHDLVMAPGYFIAGIYMFSLTLQLCIYASWIYIYLVCDILFGIFYIMQYIFFYSYFLNFNRCVQTMTQRPIAIQKQWVGALLCSINNQSKFILEIALAAVIKWLCSSKNVVHVQFCP